MPSAGAHQGRCSPDPGAPEDRRVAESGSHILSGAEAGKERGTRKSMAFRLYSAGHTEPWKHHEAGEWCDQVPVGEIAFRQLCGGKPSLGQPAGAVTMIWEGNSGPAVLGGLVKPRWGCGIEFESWWDIEERGQLAFGHPRFRRDLT